MTTLHLRQQGSIVRRDVERLEVTKKDKETDKKIVLLSEPIHTLEQVNLYGAVGLTSQAAALLLTNDVDTLFFTWGGRYLGHLMANGSRFAHLRHRQLRLSGDEKACLTLSKEIVAAKIAGQRQLLEELSEQSTGNVTNLLAHAGRSIAQMQSEMRRATTLDELRGFEGKSAFFYFAAIRHLLDPKWKFETRAYHPSPDPFNALLSFGYALLQKDVTATVHRVGLDPYLGCLHVIEYGRPSLVLDLMEEFRPLLVDRMVLDLVLAGKIKPTDFTYTQRAERPIVIEEKKIPEVIAVYEARCDDLLRHKPSNRETRLRNCIELQTRLYAHIILGERESFAGVL